MKIVFPHNRNSLSWTVFLLLLSGMGLITWFGIIPFQGRITEKADSIQEFFASRENRERQIGKLPDLQKQAESIVADGPALRILLSEDKIVNFVKTLEGLATETGTTIAIQATGNDAIEDGTLASGEVKKKRVQLKNESVPISIIDSLPYNHYLHVTVTVAGSYRDIILFLHKMETLPFGIDVVGLKIRPHAQGKQSVLPSSPGNNPFLVLSSGTLVAGDTASNPSPETTANPLPLSPLEASFETVIYLSK